MLNTKFDTNETQKCDLFDILTYKQTKTIYSDNRVNHLHSLMERITCFLGILMARAWLNSSEPSGRSIINGLV